MHVHSLFVHVGDARMQIGAVEAGLPRRQPRQSVLDRAGSEGVTSVGVCDPREAVRGQRLLDSARLEVRMDIDDLRHGRGSYTSRILECKQRLAYVYEKIPVPSLSAAMDADMSSHMTMGTCIR